MAAYIIGSITITDPERYREYGQRVPGVVQQYGGKYLVRGGAVTKLEGTRDLNRVVVIAFPDTAALRRFYDSEDYAPLIKLRQSASTGDIAIVEGVA
jgi:uncharacterized protein (DUF1330 family)